MSRNRKPQLAAKPLGRRLFELTQSLLVLRDSVDAVRAGKGHQLIPLSGQLRALLTDRSKNNPPLLLDLAGIVGDPLTIFASPGVQDGSPSQDALIFHFTGFPLSLQQEFPSQRATTLEAILSQDVVKDGGAKYSIKDLVDYFANKAGGAHYSREMSANLAQLVESGPLGLSLLPNALLQVGEATLRVGHRLVQRLVDFDLHLVVHVVKETQGHPGFILDSQYEGAPMRISIFVDPMHRLHFRVFGVSGSGAQVIADRLIDWALTHHFVFRLRIEPDLATVISILCDGDLVGSLRVAEPLFVQNDPLHYDTLYNRSHDPSGWQPISFCLAETAVFGSGQSPAEQAEALLHFTASAAEDDLPCLYFSSNAFGHSPPGTKDMTLNSGIMWNASKIRLGAMPNGYTSDA